MGSSQWSCSARWSCLTRHSGTGKTHQLLQVHSWSMSDLTSLQADSSVASQADGSIINTRAVAVPCSELQGFNAHHCPQLVHVAKSDRKVGKGF